MFKRAARRWRRSLGWILLFSFVVTLAMGIYTYFYEPERYVAQYTLYASEGSLTGDALSDTLSPVRMWMVIRDLDKLLDDAEFRAQIVASHPSDGKTYVSARGSILSHMITVRAAGPDAEIVTELANAAGDRLVAMAPQLTGVKDIRTVSRAVRPTEPALPNRPERLVETLLCSFLLFSLLAIFFGSRREPVGWLSHQNVMSVPCMGQVADFEKEAESCARKLGKMKNQGRLCTRVDRLVREGVSETALSLRAAADMQSCAIAVTGVRAEDDSAALAVLLGQTLAEEGFSILMLDMDGDAPALNRYLGVHGNVDTVDCIRDDKMLPRALLGTSMRNLHFIDCCHDGETVRNTAASQAFRLFLEQALEVYDYVILNTPPASFGSGAAIVGSAAHQTLVAASERRYTAKELEGVAAALGRGGAKVSGVVFTGVKKRQLRGVYDDDGRAYRKQLNRKVSA